MAPPRCQPCPFGDFQQFIFALASFGPQTIASCYGFSDDSPRRPLRSRNWLRNVFIFTSKWLDEDHLWSGSGRRWNLIENPCVLPMICLRKQTVEMVAMTCCPFELGSPFPSPEKIHEHSVLPEGKRNERWMPEYHIVLYLACVWL